MGRRCRTAKKVPKPVDIHVRNRVRMRRNALGMSQTTLAEAIGLTFQQVQKYVKATNRMGSSRLQQVANALKVPVTFFFEGAPGQPKIDRDSPSVAFVSDFLAASDRPALIRTFVRLRDAKLRRSISFVKEVAGR